MADISETAHELRIAVSNLMIKLRTEHVFPSSHGVILGRLDREGPQTLSELARAERMTVGSLRQVIGHLHGDGLIAKERDPSDGRRAVVAITDHGRILLAEDRHKRDALLARSISKMLDAAEQQILRDAVPILERLATTSRAAGCDVHTSASRLGSAG